ncbi:MAG: hypothetical protein ACXV74_03060 [Methylobacter sp.]
MNEKTLRKNCRMVERRSCFIGSCPGLFYGGCHGSDGKQVFAELYEIVEETVALYQQEGKFLPPPTAGKDYANKMLNDCLIKLWFVRKYQIYSTHNWVTGNMH